MTHLRFRLTGVLNFAKAILNAAFRLLVQVTQDKSD